MPWYFFSNKMLKILQSNSNQGEKRKNKRRSHSQCAQNGYEKDIHFWTLKPGEGSEWQHFPLPITSKTHYMTDMLKFGISEPMPKFHTFLMSSC